MSVGDGFITHMAAAPTDTMDRDRGDVAAPRRRGKSKAPNFTYDGPVSVIRLELDASDERAAAAVGAAVGGGVSAAAGIAARRRGPVPGVLGGPPRARGDPKALRERLGLSRKGIEAAAKGHIEASGWMRDHLTKAVGLHLADEVWQTIDRHLFADASGRRHGPPRIGSWWDFTRIPGPGPLPHESQTGVGDLAAGRHPRRAPGRLPAPAATRLVTTAAAAADRPAGPRSWPSRPGWPRRAPASGSWWDHVGALAVVFTGLPARGSRRCRCGWPRVRASGHTCAISWPTRTSGTRSTWCGCGTAEPPAAGGTTRIC